MPWLFITALILPFAIFGSLQIFPHIVSTKEEAAGLDDLLVTLSTMKLMASIVFESILPAGQAFQRAI